MLPVMPREEHALSLILQARLEEKALDWWQQRKNAVSAATVGASLAACGRRLGDSTIELSDAERSSLHAQGLPDLRNWSLATLGRVVLLHELCRQQSASECPELVMRCYRRGDNAERQAVLRALPCLPEPESFLEVALDACRSHVQSVFEAIACENAFPARYFPDLGFHQMVLKAFFTEVATTRIVELPKRRCSELTRMARGYASERRAAGRSVPEDLDYVIGLS